MTVLNLIDKFGKEIKCKVCLAFYLFFATSFYKFSLTGAGKLHSVIIYNMRLKLVKNFILGLNTLQFGIIHWFR